MQQSFEERVRLRKAKEKKLLQVIGGAIAGVLVLVALYCAYLVFSDDLWSGKLKDSKNQATEASSLKDQLNIVVMGVDKRDDDVGRSDTLFVVSLNPKTKEIFQLSIPRDTRVHIPGHGWDKINHTYAMGGKDLTIKTVEEFLGIKVQHFVEIDFHGFYKIIDAIGGIDIDVEKRMYYEDSWDSDGGLVIDLKPGMQHMDGKTAITYVRYRDEDGDIGRIARQQKFMKAVTEKISSPSIIPRLPMIISEISGAVTTDLSTFELLNLGRFFKESREKGLQTNMGMVPGGGYYIQGISYWIPNMDELLSQIDEFDGIAPTAEWKRWAEKQKALYWDELPTFDEEGADYSAKEEVTKPEEKDKKSADGKLTDPKKSTTGTSTTGTKTTSPTVKPGETTTPKPVGGPKPTIPTTPKTTP